jgi:hypothetical protein
MERIRFQFFSLRQYAQVRWATKDYDGLRGECSFAVLLPPPVLLALGRECPATTFVNGSENRREGDLADVRRCWRFVREPESLRLPFLGGSVRWDDCANTVSLDPITG